MRKSWTVILFLVLVPLMTVTSAYGQNPTAVASTVGVYVTDSYQSCPAEPVKVDIWFHNGTSYEFHNRCYTNAAIDPVYPGQGFCAFKYPMPVGTSRNKILVRSWKMNASCTQYMDTIAPSSPTSYVDVHPGTDVIADGAYHAYPDRLITINKPTYKIRSERNGGAIYEF